MVKPLLASVLPLYALGYVHFLVFLALIVLARVLLELKKDRRTNTGRLPFPPGPRPWPVIGNLLDLARRDESTAYNDMAKTYGDLVYLQVLGQPLLFVNSFRTANDLFEKRSSLYSDRKRSVMINDLQGWDWSFGHMPYGDEWKAHRKMFHHEFQQSAVPSYAFVHEREARKLAKRLLREPHNLREHFRLNAAGVIMGAVYGIEEQQDCERFLAVAEKALEGMAAAAKPGEFLVEFLPFLRHLPEWCPGSGFLKKAKVWRKAVADMRDLPFEVTASALASGKFRPSFVSNLLARVEGKPDATSQLDVIRNCAGLAYAAGAESTVSTLTTFVLAMVMHPEVSAKARLELEEVIGIDRLPRQTDRLSLPYINAIVKEVLRWNPVAPLGLPHMLSKDDEYNGYHIPAGTLVIGNTWTILHDPTIFANPSIFNPDRFLSSATRSSSLSASSADAGDSPLSSPQFSNGHPLSSAFGYGRRVCPGRFMAEQQLFVTVATILQLFEISPGLDRCGDPVPVEPRFSSGMICHPMPFEYTIKPRGAYVQALLE